VTNNKGEMMSDKKDIIKKELDEVDQQVNPEDPNGKPHGKPKTDREKLRREQFIKLYGRE